MIYKMNILSIQHSLKHKALEIYVAGCAGNPHCEGCHNPESWDFNQGTPWRDCLDEIREKCKHHPRLIKNIWILGGEPLDQDVAELTHMLSLLHYELRLPIWLFTRYEINEIPSVVAEHCDYIKCGRYLPAQATQNHEQYGVELASANQRIYDTRKSSMAFWR